jgi:hypothetical protein
MNVRLDEARQNQPATQIRLRRIGAKACFDDGKAPADDADIDAVRLASGDARIAIDMVQTHSRTLAPGLAPCWEEGEPSSIEWFRQQLRSDDQPGDHFGIDAFPTFLDIDAR